MVTFKHQPALTSQLIAWIVMSSDFSQQTISDFQKH